MREILFKAKRIDNGEWVIGNLVYSEDAEEGWDALIIPSINSVFQNKIEGYIGIEIFYCVDKDTICQYTGLTDKNGNKIWENDVVKGKYWERGNSHRHIGEIKYIGNAFKVVGVKQYKGYHDELNGSYEIIGNIFDNPELLGV